MKNKINPNIKVYAKIYTGNMDDYEEIEVELIPDIYTLSSQLNKLLKRVEDSSRTLLLREHANNITKELNSAETFSSKQQAAYVIVIIHYNSIVATYFKSDEVSLTPESITKGMVFHWMTIDKAKAKLAMEAVEFFEALVQ